MKAKDLVDWRERHALNQTAAGEILGKDRKTLYRYESGEAEIPPAVELACGMFDRYAETIKVNEAAIAKIDAGELRIFEGLPGAHRDTTAEHRARHVSSVQQAKAVIRRLAGK
ncbi:MAG TPA: hypothetical protein VJ890_14965 [Vineibacter sp.]|nr:hypothetical protein [Vineibacter sp.]